MLLILCGYGVSKIYSDMNDEDLQGASNQVTHWARWVSDHFRAPKSLEIELMLPEGEAIDRAASIATLVEVERFLSDQIEHLGPAQSILGPLYRVHHFLSGQPDMEKPSTFTDATIAEAFLFLPPVIADSWISLDRRQVRFSVEAPYLSTREAEQALSEVAAFFAAKLPKGWRYELTGTVPLATQANLGMLKAQLKTFCLAFVLVFLCLAAGFRSFRLATLGMIPNIFPIVIVAGSLGWLGISFDIAMAMVGAVILGIAVDDTIHLMLRYRHEAPGVNEKIGQCR